MVVILVVVSEWLAQMEIAAGEVVIAIETLLEEEEEEEEALVVILVGVVEVEVVGLDAVHQETIAIGHPRMTITCSFFFSFFFFLPSPPA